MAPLRVAARPDRDGLGPRVSKTPAAALPPSLVCRTLRATGCRGRRWQGPGLRGRGEASSGLPPPARHSAQTAPRGRPFHNEGLLFAPDPLWRPARATARPSSEGRKGPPVRLGCGPPGQGRVGRRTLRGRALQQGAELEGTVTTASPLTAPPPARPSSFWKVPNPRSLRAGPAVL